VPIWHGPRVLRDRELSHAVRDAVLHAGLVERITVIKISLEQIRRAAIDVSCPALICNFARADLARCGSTIFVVCFVLKIPPCLAGESAAMPDQHGDDQHERYGAKRGAQ